MESNKVSRIIKIELKKANSPAELELVFPVIKELRSHLTFSRYIELIQESSKRDHYELIAAYEDHKCVGVMGYRILFDFVHGKHLYIDDLVVTKTHRSRKIGALFLRHAETVALDLQCEGLRLCTGVDNDAGKRFYEREGWTLRAVAYKKKL